jgi:diguanylate cyclase (GGDEF)-like protein/PAS domain S-box-containing protein
VNRRTRPPNRVSTECDVTDQVAVNSGSVAGGSQYGVLRSWAVVAGLVVATVGLGVMVGWLLDVESLKRIGPGLVTMKFNTAFCLALLGTAIVAGGHSPVARVASATVGAIATISLAEFVTGWNAGIDEALFLDPAAGTIYPGRMAFVTALCLCLAAIGLVALRLGRRRLVTASALGLLTVGWLGCLGYLFGFRALYDVGRFSTMAAHTAAALAILGVGLLASTPNGPLPWIVRGDDPGSTVLRRILPAALVGVPVVAGVTLIGDNAGWYGTGFSVAFMVVAASSGVSAVAMHMARVVNRSHAARGVAQQTLRDLNASLEARIEARTAELVTSEAWARVLAGSAPVGIFHMDTHGRYTYVNDQWCEIAGVSADDALRDGWEGLLHADDRDWVAGEWRSAAAAGIEFDAEFRVVRPTGETLWVHSHSAQVDDAGDAAGYVGTVADITSRRKAEADLRATEELFRITFGSSPVGMALVDAKGQIVQANHALCDLTKHALDELLGMRLESILHPDNAGNGESGFGIAGVDQRIVRSDGSVGWASIRCAQIGEHGTDDPAFTIVQFVDTTERREFEDRLAHMANHDPLTGLLNRRSFGAALGNHVAQCKRYGPAGALLILDLDHFKRINDTRGHNVGDQVIVTIANLLRQRLRESDLCARLGGDEFAVLLPTGDAAVARAVAQILVEEVRTYAAAIASENIALSASVGIAAFDGTNRSSDEMLVNADLAMYDAKALGRDRWAEFTTATYDEPLVELTSRD